MYNFVVCGFWLIGCKVIVVWVLIWVCVSNLLRLLIFFLVVMGCLILLVCCKVEFRIGNFFFIVILGDIVI